MMVRASRSCWAALVAKPLRRLWPAKSLGSMPSMPMYFLTIRATALSLSWVSLGSWLRLKPRNSGPVWILAASIQALTARTVQVRGSGE